MAESDARLSKDVILPARDITGSRDPRRMGITDVDMLKSETLHAKWVISPFFGFFRLMFFFMFCHAPVYFFQ